MILPNEKQISYGDEINITANMEGSITHFKAENEMFIIFSNIEKSGVNTTYELLCVTGAPTEVKENYTIFCSYNFDSGFSVEYENIYLLPYYIPYSPKYPYEVIINKEIKGTNGSDPEPEPDPEPDPDPEPSSSHLLKSSKYILAAFLFLF